MRNKNLISISGRLGSGKDEIGKIIQYLTSKETGPYPAWLNSQKVYGPDPTITYQVRKFAAKLKEIVSLLTGCKVSDLENIDFKNSKLGSEWDDSHGIDTYRQLLQVLGTDAIRDVIHENAWVNALFADYKSFQSIQFVMVDIGKMDQMEILSPPTYIDYPKWILTDTRFPNELEAVKKRGGITIRVNRDNGTRAIDLNPHASETALDESTFDHVIDNSGDINHLVAQVRDILEMENIIERKYKEMTQEEVQRWIDFPPQGGA